MRWRTRSNRISRRRFFCSMVLVRRQEGAVDRLFGAGEGRYLQPFAFAWSACWELCALWNFCYCNRNLHEAFCMSRRKTVSKLQFKLGTNYKAMMLRTLRLRSKRLPLTLKAEGPTQMPPGCHLGSTDATQLQRSFAGWHPGGHPDATQTPLI